MNGFIVVGLDSSHNIIYISNTGPILWSGDRKDAKIFYSLSNAKNELEENFTSLSSTIKYTNINSIYILEYNNDKEVGRKKFL